MGLKRLTVLVIGGAGYIGSHVGWLCVSQGYRVIMLDNVSAKTRYDYPWALCIKGNYGDRALLESIFKESDIQVVVHCAAYTQVQDSVTRPIAYYENNVSHFSTLLDVLSKLKTMPYFLFSSSAAVYGATMRASISEDAPLAPISPYGRTKLIGEWMLEDCRRAYGLRYVAFRYFNVAGAHPQEGLFEEHVPESHLIPLVLKALRQKSAFTIFGTNYQTNDGTAIRDYVHVLDVARAHAMAIDYLQKGGMSDVFNIGSQRGTSVLEIIAEAEKIAQSKLGWRAGPMRAGDPASLVSNCEKAVQNLGWVPQMSTLELLLESAWRSSDPLSGLNESVREQGRCTS